MGHAELYVLLVLIGVLSMTTAGTCWGVWRLHTDLLALRQHVLGYRDDLD